MHREYIKAELRKRSLSVKAVAQLIGFSRQSVSDAINGRTYSPQIQAALADILELSIDEVFPQSESKGGES
jgi:lambda repressor-like predicted transcriptional regulator